MKLLIWTTTVIGLVPAIFAAIATLIVDRVRQETADFGGASLQLGPFATELRVSSSPWAAVMLLCGAGCVIIGLNFLLPAQSGSARKGDFSQLESYVGQLLRSPAKGASLIVTTQDGQGSLLLMKEGERTTLHFSIQRMLHPDQEAKLRILCEQLRISPDKEFLSSNGGVANAIANIEFAVPDDAIKITEVCKGLLTGVFGVTDRDGLMYIFNRP